MDFVLIGAVVLFALAGLVKGGAKMFFGLFMLLIIMVGAAFISSAICPLFLKNEKKDSVTYTKAATVLMDPIAGAFPKGGDFGTLLDTAVTADENGTLYIGEQTLKDAVTKKVPYVGSFVASFIESAAHKGEPLPTNWRNTHTKRHFGSYWSSCSPSFATFSARSFTAIWTVTPAPARSTA